MWLTSRINHELFRIMLFFEVFLLVLYWYLFFVTDILFNSLIYWYTLNINGRFDVVNVLFTIFAANNNNVLNGLCYFIFILSFVKNCTFVRFN